jgi:lysozyme-like protein
MATDTSTGTLSYAQLKGVWLNAAKGTQYATNAWASLMAAIAEAESGGDPTITNPYDNNGQQTSWGLWQISNGTHSAPASDWADPAGNAQLAIQKLDSQGLSAWGTYTSGAYKAFVSGKTTADLTAITGPSSADAAALTAAATAQATCAWYLGTGGIDPSILGYHPVGNVSFGFCVVSRSQARALIGAGLLFGGVLLGLAFGLGAVLAASGIGGSLAGAAAGASGAAAATRVPAAAAAL